MYSTVSILHEGIRPRTIPSFWFGGVIDWYQSIVYSELSISTDKRYKTINTLGVKYSDQEFILLSTKILN